MDRSEFQANCSGQVVLTPEGQAFVPDLLPVEIPVDLETLRALGRARGAHGEFAGESKLVRNERLILHPLMVRDAVESNKIEGTFTEIEDILKQRVTGPPPDPMAARNQREVTNYLSTLNLGAQRVGEGWPLSLNLIGALQQELLKGCAGDDRLLGEFRRVQVYIGRKSEGIQGARFVPPPPEQVRPLMENLLAYINGADGYDPLIDCAIAHYQFETIHPFEDGNGRMGRLLIPLILQSVGLLDRPILYLSAYFESHRSDYMDLMKQVSTHGDWKSWVLFFLEAVTAQAVAGQTQAAKVLELHEKYRGLVKEKTSMQATLLAIDLLMERVFVTAPELVAYAKTTYPTAKKALEMLEALEIVQSVDDNYPHVWYGSELLKSVYT